MAALAKAPGSGRTTVMTQARSIPIRESDSLQGLSLRVIENPQYKKVGITLSPLQHAHSQLVAELSRLAPTIPVLTAIPDAEDVRACDPHLVAVAKAVDAYIAAFGREISGAVIGVDLSQFTDVVMGAIDGCATHEIEAAAVAVEEGTDIRTGMWAAE
jgi:hypothetical protein